MEDHFVNKVSRFFPSSFTSCKFRSVPDDVVHCSIPTTKSSKILDHNIDPPKTFCNICKQPSMIESREPKTTLHNDKKVSKYYRKKSLLLGSEVEGRRCPPAAPVSVMASKKKERAKEIKNCISVSSSNSGRWFSSDDEEADQFDGKSDTFFSLSSCSSESFRLKTAKTIVTRVGNKMNSELNRCTSALSTYSENTTLSQYSQKTTKTSRKTADKIGNSTRSNSKTSKTFQRKDIVCDDFEINGGILNGCKVSEASTELYYNGFGGHLCRKASNGRSRRRQMMRSDHKGQCSILVEDGIEDSYAVEKSTSDPYNDFRTSMVEMIIEKQIFGVKDLEKLLGCFLSLNSSCYHKFILEAFAEICDTLFAN